jgi:Thrombospondin type 3 repeat
MNIQSFAALSLFSLACMPGVVKAQFVIAESTFDSGFDGWDEDDSQKPGDLSWQSTGGNPGGYVRLLDTGLASGQHLNSKILAPPEFLGDWSSYDGVGTISFDLATFRVGTVASLRNYSVYISNDTESISAEWLGPVHSGLVNTWGDEEAQFSVPIIEADWSVSGGTWADLLAEVTLLRMELEQVVSNGAPRDISGIDNISLSIPCDAIVTLDLRNFAYNLDGTSLGSSQDCDANGIPDECETDSDGDLVIDPCDNCPDQPNQNQEDCDGDELGNVCDDDIDGDGIANDSDVCDYTPADGHAGVLRDSTHPSYGSLLCDLDGDCDCDLADWAVFESMMTSPSCVDGLKKSDSICRLPGDQTD